MIKIYIGSSCCSLIRWFLNVLLIIQKTILFNIFAIKSQKIVNDACERDLFLNYLLISFKFLVRDSFMPLLVSFKGYEYEFPIVSDGSLFFCSPSSHIYTECKSVLRSCIHCQDSHPASAVICFLRKKFLAVSENVFFLVIINFR